MDIKAIVLALEEYEKFKGLLPAIKAEYESIVKMIEKIKEIYKIEKAAYDDVVSKRVSLLDEIKLQKDLWLKEYADGKAALVKMNADAAEIMRLAKLAEAEVKTLKDATDKAAEGHKSKLEDFETKIGKLKEIMKNLF